MRQPRTGLCHPPREPQVRLHDVEKLLVTSLLLCRFHVEEEGKGVDASGNKVKADKEADSAVVAHDGSAIE